MTPGDDSFSLGFALDQYSQKTLGMPGDTAARVDGAMAEAIITDDEANGGETVRCGHGVGS